MDFGFGVGVVWRGLIACERWVFLIVWTDAVQVVVWGCFWLGWLPVVCGVWCFRVWRVGWVYCDWWICFCFGYVMSASDHSILVC